MMRVTTIVLADDHPVVRGGMRSLLAAERDCSVVGEAGDGLTAVQLVERLQPDLLIVDLMMPGLNGLDVTRQARARSPRTRVIILSMHSNEAYVVEAWRSGVAGYVLKDSGSGDLVRAVREVAAGRRYLSPPLSERTIELYLSKAQGDVIDMYDTLTRRERQVLHLAAEGLTNAEIAARLSISPRTAEEHRGNLMRKLSLHSQTELVKYAAKRGIIGIE